MGILCIKTFTSSEEKLGCPFPLLCGVMKVFSFSDMDEKYLCWNSNLKWATIQIHTFENLQQKMSVFINAEKMWYAWWSLILI